MTPTGQIRELLTCLRGLLCIEAACLFLRTSSTDFLADCGIIFWILFGLGGLVLCVLSGRISRQERDEANGLRHPDNLEGKN